MDAQSPAARIALSAFEIDGMTRNGGPHDIDDSRERESFKVHGGLGTKLRRQGVASRASGAVARRLANLGCTHFSRGVDDKYSAAKKLTHLFTEAGGAHGTARQASEFTLPARSKPALAFAPYLEQA